MQTITLPRAGNPSDHSAVYEMKAVLLLFFGFGMVGLDRFIINPLFPVMTRDLGLSYQDLGLVSGVLALTWGLAALFSGSLADRIGPKKVLIPAMVVFSLLSAFTGLASGLVSLLVIRGLMGLSEGAYMPAGIVSTIDASKPSRIGLNCGITQMAIGLFGMGIAPILATQMLSVVPSWHYVFALVAVPGLVLAVLLAKVLRTPKLHAAATEPAAGGWREVLGYRNIVFATLAMLCWLSCMVMMQAFMPNYLTDHLKLGLEAMGYVLSGGGIGAVLGMVGLPALSDRLGRRRVMLVAAAVLLVSLWLLGQTGAEPARLFALILVVTLAFTGLIVITIGPLATGSVPPHLAATASGLVMGVAEIIGGAIVPAMAGALATAQGITVIMPIAQGAIALGLLITAFGIREPAQRV